MANENTQIIRDLNGQRLRITSGGILSVEAGSTTLLSRNAGTLNVATGLTLADEGREIHRSNFALVSTVVSTVDATTNGAQGNLKLYTFPRGLIYILGASTNLTLLGDGTGITATSAVVAALGTVVPAVDVTLTGTEANIIPSTACTLVASAGAFRGKSTTPAFFDNTTTTNATILASYLNFATVDAGSTANGTITVNGTIEIYWMHLGDS
jgi:hypothetical protein